MKKIILIFIFFGLTISIKAQSNRYELEFSSISKDYVNIPNSSSSIANKTSFSISCWVNPQPNTTHSGIIGFRNNTNADFYLLQLQNTNNLEARFRNSSNIAFDIVANNLLTFNQWQHLAFTYDGNKISLYKDGLLIDTTSANGTIIQINESFRLGGLDYFNDVFHMNGRLDEVQLWDVALTQNEINNWMCISISNNHLKYNNLMGYWKLDEGTGTNISDLSPNSFSGTLINNPLWCLNTNCLGSTQIYGCTNPQACNFDSLATIDDSSCNFLDPVIAINNVTCFGGNNAFVDITLFGGVSPYFFTLNNGVTQSNGSFQNLSAGTYFFDVSDANGCSSRNIFTITEPKLSQSFDTITASSSIFWNGMNLFKSGDYTDTIVNSSGCDSIVKLNLTINMTSILDLKNNSRIIKISDILGKRSNQTENSLIFYLRNNGTYEKRKILKTQ